MRYHEIITESLGPHAVREISFKAKRSLAQHCIHISKNLGEPHDMQVITSIRKVGLFGAEVKITLIGPSKPVQQIAELLQRGTRNGGLRQFTMHDPDAVGVDPQLTPRQIGLKYHGRRREAQDASKGS